MKCECDLNEYVLVHHWYILVQTGLYKAFPKLWSADMFLTLDCGETIVFVWNMYIVVPKHLNTGAFTEKSSCLAVGTYMYVPSTYMYIPVCTRITKNILRILFCDF